MPYKTTDTTFAAWIGFTRHLPIVLGPKVKGRAVFIVLDLDDEQGARLRVEYEQTGVFEVDCRRRALASQILDE